MTVHLVSGEIKGIGVASSKSAAKETAAQQALQVRLLLLFPRFSFDR